MTHSRLHPKPAKHKPSELPAYLQRTLLAFHSFVEEFDTRPSYSQLGKRMKISTSCARDFVERLAEPERALLVKVTATRYAPWKLTPKGLRLAKKLAKKAAK